MVARSRRRAFEAPRSARMHRERVSAAARARPTNDASKPRAFAALALGGARDSAVVDRRVRFVRARREDRPLVDEEALRHVVTLNGAEEEDARRREVDMSDARAGARGMSTRGKDRGDDLYDTADVHMKWTSARRAGAGLANLGNTCFLNSVLACLTQTPALAHFALNGEHKQYKSGGSFNALYEIGEHVARALNSSGRTIAPVAFVKNMRALSKTFRKGRQEDAHELARCLLDAMHKKSVEIVKPKISPNSARAETSFVWKVFGGKLRSQVNCKTCGRNSETFDPFLDLSLEVGRAKSVVGAFKLFTQVEVLDGDNKYRCEGKSANSKSHLTKASKQFTVHEPPNVLALQLKRFAYVPFGRGKLSHFVEYPLELDITPYLSDESHGSKGKAVYDLYGVLVHAGNSSNSGHYYCFTKTATGTWCEMDDEDINPVSEKVVLKQQAYLLFYARRNAPGTFEELCKNVPDGGRVQKQKGSEKEKKIVPKKRKEEKKEEAPKPVKKKLVVKEKPKMVAEKSEDEAKKKKEPKPLAREKTEEDTDVSPRVKTSKLSSSKKKMKSSSLSPPLSIGKGIRLRGVRSKSPSGRSAFDSATRALLYRRLRRLSNSVGVTLEDIPEVSLDSPMRTRNRPKHGAAAAAADSRAAAAVRDWMNKPSRSAKWDDDENAANDDRNRSKKRGQGDATGIKSYLKSKRAKREYDEFDEEYDRGKIPKHKRRKMRDTAPPLPKRGFSNPFQRRQSAKRR